MIQAEDLCQKCKYFDSSNHECEQKQYLDPWKFTIECEDFWSIEENHENNEVINI